jgi:hypothetical protein
VCLVNLERPAGLKRIRRPSEEHFKTGCLLRINGTMISLKRFHVCRASLIKQIGTTVKLYRVMIIVHSCAVD